MDRTDLERRFFFLSGKLISELNDEGFWTGELSSSALSTAVATVTLKLGNPGQFHDRIVRGIAWLISHVNEDGGFGDTPESVSNVSTTLLCYAAFRLYEEDNHHPPQSGSSERTPGLQSAGTPDPAPILAGMECYLRTQGVEIGSAGVVDSILGYYDKDYTFSVPILSMLAICRVLDQSSVDQIPRLPFELVMLPSRLYRFFNLHVVSYAIPALIAMGIFVFKQGGGGNPVVNFVRKQAIGPALRKLQSLMPQSGGFLEAIPLTAFVSMCLIRSDFSSHQVVVQGIDFLKNTQRPDGSWPIDTDLSTWVTTLSIKAMGNHLGRLLSNEQTARLCSHLLAHQYRQVHPFNQASPGGWGWTSSPGSVPDADDTAGAILALMTADRENEEVEAAVLRGCKWLAGLQNRDGGIPTFCRGWGLLPFDRSCADLTGHAILAWVKAIEHYGRGMQKSDGRDTNYPVHGNLKQYEKTLRKLNKHVKGALRFLAKEQLPDGSWLPLWFGSQLTGDKTNPVYGTARVMVYLQDALAGENPDLAIRKLIEPMLVAAGQYLAGIQNRDGSWGPGKEIAGSIEETALSVCALIASEPARCGKAMEWLEKEYIMTGCRPKPIGLYFATLWYHEKLYPVVYYLEALRKALAGAGPAC
jgi:hypothetical protein